MSSLLLLILFFDIVSSCLLRLMSFVVFVPLCHCSASLCFYPPFCLMSNLRYLLTYLLVIIIRNYFDFSSLYLRWYDWLYDLFVAHDLCGCSVRSQWCMLKSVFAIIVWNVKGMRSSSLTIVCIISVFPFFSIFSWPGANCFFLLLLFCLMCHK